MSSPKARAITWRFELSERSVLVTFNFQSRVITVQWEQEGEQRVVFMQANDHDKRQWQPRTEACARRAMSQALEQGTVSQRTRPSQRPVQAKQLDAHQRQLPIGDR